MDNIAVSARLQHPRVPFSPYGTASHPYSFPGRPKLSCRLLKVRQDQLGSRSPLTSSSIGSAFLSRCDATLADTCSTQPDELANADWDNLGSGLVPTDYMYVMKCSKGETFTEGHIEPFGDIELSPSAGVLNYGQGVIEGVKAYRKRDGVIVLFRPEENALRMIAGAERMCMPAPTVEHFMEAVKATVAANRRWVPPCRKGFLYIRPLLIGSGAVLGLAPSTEYTFLIYASPVGNYFKTGVEPINVKAEVKVHRGTRGGVGGVKAIGNYAAILKPQIDAQSKGFSDVLYMDSGRNRFLEGMSSSHIFLVKLSQKVIFTPELGGTILPGIMRKSVIEIAQSLGYTVHECDVELEELAKADEAFCTGTALGVWPVGCIDYCGTEIFLGRRMSDGTRLGIGKATLKIRTALSRLLMGGVEDKNNWIVKL